MADQESNQFLFQKINTKRDLQDQSSISIDDSSDSDSAFSSSSSSSSSIELTEDASSSSSSSSNLIISNAKNGPLFELSEIMAQLPIKRGLSKFYKGKSQSYTSMASVKSVEDLAKKVNINIKYRSKMKSSKSFAGLVLYSPKPTISKNKATSRGSLLSSFK